MRKIVISLLAIVCCIPVWAQQEVVNGETGILLDTYLSRTVPFGFSGAVLVAKNGEILLNKGYGYSNKEKKTGIEVTSVFSTGSLTKQFTAAAIMKLEMLGKLGTDDRLIRYFPELPVDKKDITIRQLLTHTSGLPLAFSNDDFEEISREDYQKKALNAKLQFQPGENFRYSNVGYVLLAMLIEDLSGLNYEAFLQENLFGPAGMTQTGYSSPNWENNRFTGIYNGNTYNGTTEKFTGPTWHLIGNGGLLSTTTDMYKWVTALKQDVVLSTEAKEKMFTPFLNDYAFGWDVLDNGNLRQHNGGSFLGNGAELRWFLEDDLVIMIFTNNTIGGKIGYTLVRNELEALLMGDSIPMPPAIQVKEVDLSPFLGTYRLPSGETFEIGGNDSSTDLRIQGQEVLDLLMDPVNYRPGGVNVELNNKFESAFSKAFETDDFTGFNFTGAAEKLKREIKNELKLEGIETPNFKILRTMPSQRSGDLKITQVALNAAEDFQGESLKLNIVTENEKFAGLGVDFGFVNPISLGMYPIGNHTFQLYDLNSKIGAELKMIKKSGTSIALTVGDTSVSAIKVTD